MDKSVIGIASGNGWPFLSLRERFAAFQRTGFQSLLLWWGDGEKETRKERVSLAKEYRLQIENAHAEMARSNSLWEPGPRGDRKADELVEAVEDCARYEIRRMVLHLTNGSSPPGISDIGLRRIETLIENATKYDVTLAFENVRTDQHVRYVLDRCRDRHVAFCYDTGHANAWNKDTDWLSMYADRLAAVHIHDNNGREDEHTFPFQGTIDWKTAMRKMDESSYSGSLTLEAEYQGEENVAQLNQFLEATYQSGLSLALL